MPERHVGDAMRADAAGILGVGVNQPALERLDRGVRIVPGDRQLGGVEQNAHAANVQPIEKCDERNRIAGRFQGDHDAGAVAMPAQIEQRFLQESQRRIIFLWGSSVACAIG